MDCVFCATGLADRSHNHCHSSPVLVDHSILAGAFGDFTCPHLYTAWYPCVHHICLVGQNQTCLLRILWLVFKI